MKRAREIVKNYNKIEKKVAKEEEKLSTLQNQKSETRVALLAELERKSGRQWRKYIRHAPFSEIPLLRKNPFNAFLSKQARDEAAPSQLGMLFACMPELADAILCHLGPMEMFNLAYTSYEFEFIVTRSFLQIAPSLLERYSYNFMKSTDPDLVDGREECVAYTKSLTQAIVNQRVNITQPLGRMLDGWYIYFNEYRTYSPCSCRSDAVPADYCFLCDLTTGEDVHVRANHTNFYHLRNYKKASVAMAERFKVLCGDNAATIGAIKKKDRLRYFNDGEFEAMNIRALHGDRDVYHNRSLAIIRDTETNRLELLGETPIRLHCASPFGQGPHTNPFIDLYEIRCHSRCYGCNDTGEPGDLDLFLEKLQS